MMREDWFIQMDGYGGGRRERGAVSGQKGCCTGPGSPMSSLSELIVHGPWSGG